MLFNSFEFALFLPIVFILYWFVLNRNLKVQNLLLLAGSYLFYGWWDWRFLSLIVFSSFVDYGVGLQLHKSDEALTRKNWLAVSMITNLGLLGFFKYYNFFADSFAEAVARFGIHPSPYTLNIILPVGISFITFQTMSYTIDIYRRQLEPTRDLISFFAFVSFFPQLVAGPIERASNLLPQFYKKRKFSYDQGVNALHLIALGLFKKIVIADRLAIYVNQVYDNPAGYSSFALIIATIFFAIQIYCDFSGYSDIAIGTARLLGFDLMTNFNRPYLADSFSDFWRRWHISLSSWFRDYLYIPSWEETG